MNNVISVFELTTYIKSRLENDVNLQYILVKGEISNLKKHQSGHWYFTLKDEKSKINAVMFASNAYKIKFRVEDGMSVVVTAGIGVYEASGSYQLYVRDIQPLGVGLLYLKYEQLKKDLEKEGIFSERYKKTIPTFPKTIVIISAPKGAAIKDLYTTITRRYKLANLILIPSLVQGESAKDEIAKAIVKANEFNPSVIILARGGGSIEDLWAFNEEIVARAIVNSPVPVISAVGHETDFTIADFASSLRAPTPTAAGELATPNLAEIMMKIDDFKKRLINSYLNMINSSKERLTKTASHGVLVRSEFLYAAKRMQLDSLLMRFNETKRAFFNLYETHNTQLITRLKTAFNNNIKDLNQNYLNVNRSLGLTYNVNYMQISHNFKTLVTKLDALSPLKIMSLGYAFTLDKDNHVITSVKDVKIDDEVNIVFNDGMIKTIVKSKEETNNGN
jgi:exodeoxyribonuclease VII large subunit